MTGWDSGSATDITRTAIRGKNKGTREAKSLFSSLRQAARPMVRASLLAKREHEAYYFRSCQWPFLFGASNGDPHFDFRRSCFGRWLCRTSAGPALGSRRGIRDSWSSLRDSGAGEDSSVAAGADGRRGGERRPKSLVTCSQSAEGN